MKGKIKITPPQLLTLSFLFLIILGTFLLRADFSSNGKPLSWIEAFFTAVSGVCVTGLTVIDISSRLSSLGKIILLALIQMGGLGLMSFSVATLYFLRRPATIVQRDSIINSFSPEQSIEIKNILKSVFLFTFVIEGFGTTVFF